MALLLSLDPPYFFFLFFFFNDPATTEIYTLSLHDALPISHFVDLDRLSVEHRGQELDDAVRLVGPGVREHLVEHHAQDRKSTRLNSSHVEISYAVFCLKKKKKKIKKK